MLIDADLLTPDSLPTPMNRANNFWYVRRDPNDVIVFLHGIFSSSLTCWLYEDKVSGHKVFWPDLVRGDARFGNASIYLAGYYTAPDSGDFSIADCARQVFDALAMVGEDGTAPVLQATRITLVCHSMGGIVARYMIERNLSSFHDKALGLALIASPSLGSKWANLVGAAARYYNQRQGQQLRWQGEALEDLHRRFRDLVNDRANRLPGLFGMEACENKMVFRSSLPAFIRWLLPPRFQVVTALSAGQYFGEVKVLPDTDHFTAVKPDGVNHPAHEFLVTFEREFHRAVPGPVATVAAAPQAAVPATAMPASELDIDLDNGAWPELAADVAMQLVVSATRTAGDLPLAIVTCIAIRDTRPLEDALGELTQSWLRDPFVRDIPGIAEIVRRRDLTSPTLDEELKTRLIAWLSTQLFEAYVCYSRKPLFQGQREQLLGALLADRVMASRGRAILVMPDESIELPDSALHGVIDDVVRRVQESAKGNTATSVSLREAKRDSAASIVAALVGVIVRERLTASAGTQVRSFARIYPQKLRVLHDLDADVHYHRRRPFPG